MITCESCRQNALSRKPLNPEEKRHLEQCQECRDHELIIRKIQESGSAILPQPTAAYKKQLLEKIHSLPANSSTANQAPSLIDFSTGWIEALFQPRMLATMLILGILILTPVYWFHSPAVKPLISSMENTWIEVAGGKTETVVLPDQSKLEVTGPARLQIHSRGFRQVTGEVKAMVVPGQTVFEVQTPHGRIQVLGTVFVSKVSAAETRVRVVTGKVRILPDSGPPADLLAGGSGIMLPSSGEGLSTFSSGQLELSKPGKDVD